METRDIVRHLRISHGLTLDELAKKLGVTNSTISKYENGTVELKQSQIAKYADIFNVSPTFIMGYEGTLEEKKQLLYDMLKDLPEDKLDKIIKVIRTIVE